MRRGEERGGGRRRENKRRGVERGGRKRKQEGRTGEQRRGEEVGSERGEKR